jgi:hypothetical protein
VRRGVDRSALARVGRSLPGSSLTELNPSLRQCACARVALRLVEGGSGPSLRAGRGFLYKLLLWDWRAGNPLCPGPPFCLDGPAPVSYEGVTEPLTTGKSFVARRQARPAPLFVTSGGPNLWKTQDTLAPQREGARTTCGSGKFLWKKSAKSNWKRPSCASHGLFVQPPFFVQSLSCSAVCRG